MADFTVSDDMLNSPTAQAYFARCDKRVLIGVRATLEMLGLPIPAYAVRRPPGRPPIRAVAAAFQADNPGYQAAAKPVAQDPLGQHRLNAAVTKAQARIARQQAASNKEQS